MSAQCDLSSINIEVLVAMVLSAIAAWYGKHVHDVVRNGNTAPKAP